MKKKKIKVLGVTSAIMMAMGSLSFAASSNAFINANPNITAYNTDYNFTYTQNDGSKNEDLKVIAADQYWSVIRPFDNEDTANEISWTVVPGSTNALTSVTKQTPVSATYTNYNGPTYSGKAACAQAVVDTTKTPGVAVAEATNDAGGYMDFTFVVNASSKQNMSNINVRAYDNTSGSLVGLKSGSGEVSSDAVETTINYASAMDSISLVSNSYTSDSQYGTQFLKDVTIGNNTYKYKSGETGWVYAVYNSDGSLNKVSEKVGGETFNVSNGQTVVWVYVNYNSDYTANVTFPSNLSSLPTIN